jgi:hypothetical protein
MVELRSDEASQSGPVRPATATSAVGVIRVLLTVLRSHPVYQIQSFRLIALFGLVQFASQNLRTRTSDFSMTEDLY